MATSYEAIGSAEVPISGDAPAVRSSDDEGIGRAAEKKTSKSPKSYNQYLISQRSNEEKTR